MMNNKRMMPLLLGVSALTMTITSQAGSPLWIFTPLTPTTLSVPSNSTATVQYRVTNQSPAPHTLMMAPMTGITQTTTAGNCPNPFTLSPGNPSCTLTLLVTGSALNADIHGGPKVCQQGPDGNLSPLQCYQPSQTDSLSILVAAPVSLSTTISASVATLALNTSGVARTITVTNTGASTATSVTYSPSPALPAGTTITPANCGNIAPAGRCVLTISPGATPSAAAYDTTNIVTYYNANRAAGGAVPTPLTQYASGLCKASIGGYTDWYLPAICEMGPASNGSGCVSGTPNMVTNLPLLLISCTGTSCLSGYYWSSTEDSGNPTNGAWVQYFSSGGSGVQGGASKNNTVGVRCSRALTL